MKSAADSAVPAWVPAYPWPANCCADGFAAAQGGLASRAAVHVPHDNSCYSIDIEQSHDYRVNFWEGEICSTPHPCLLAEGARYTCVATAAQ